MNVNPVLYAQANKTQRNDAKEILSEFFDVLQLRPNGKDSVMDVGCGAGDILVDFIVPILPTTYSKAVGTDISPRMIQYARDTYAAYDKVKFKVLDIQTDNMACEYHDQFDHVTSFFCLHWVLNERQALRNMYKMLHKGGDLLLVFIPSLLGFDAFHIIAADPKWNEYLKDVIKFIPPLHKHPDPLLTYEKLLTEIGFVDCSVEIRQRTFVYEGHESFRNHVISITPFIERIPLHNQEEYKNAMCEQWKAFCLCEKMPHNDDYRYTLSYPLVVAYAKK